MVGDTRLKLLIKKKGLFMDDFELRHLDIEKQQNFDEIIQNILSYHTPMLYELNSEKKNRKESVASSIYIKYCNYECLVTVGHVLIKRNLKEIYINLTDIKLSDFNKGIVYLPDKKDNNIYDMDYSIFFISSEISEKLKQNYIPINVREDVKKEKFTSLWYFVFGFPATKNILKNNLQKAYYYCMHLPLYKDRINNTYYDQNFHIALQIEKDKLLETKDLDKKLYRQAPDLHGISGCGMWTIPGYPFDCNFYSLQGMIISYDKKENILFGFNIQDIVNMIEITKDKYEENNFTGIVYSILKENE